MSQLNDEVADRLFDAWQRWDLDTVESLLASDAVDRRPQSGEVFVGPTNIMGMYREVPGPPAITWHHICGGPEVWAAEGIVEYGEGPVHIIGIVTLANGRVASADFFFADPFAPPPGRARWAQPTEK